MRIVGECYGTVDQLAGEDTVVPPLNGYMYISRHGPDTLGGSRLHELIVGSEHGPMTLVKGR